MYFVKTPPSFQKLLPHAKWHMRTPSEKTVYLTFDDGPTEEATEWILNDLERFNAKATFFCVGANVERHPQLYKKIIDQGHSVGNHTQHHADGFKKSGAAYLRDVIHCKSVIDSNLFRPPYGRLPNQVARALSSQYEIVMWDVLSGDFDPKITSRQCLNNVLDNIESGSIVVLHDNVKSFDKIKFVLPKILGHLDAAGFRCEALPYEPLSQSAKRMSA